MHEKCVQHVCAGQLLRSQRAGPAWGSPFESPAEPVCPGAARKAPHWPDLASEPSGAPLSARWLSVLALDGQWQRFGGVLLL